MEKKIEKITWKKWFQRDNLLILVLLGILLFVVAIPVKKEDNGNDRKSEEIVTPTQEDQQAVTRAVTSGSAGEYTMYLEEKLKTMLEAVQGLGEVEVMITLESSEEKIVEKDMSANRSNTEEQDSAGGTRTVNASQTEYQTVGDPFVVKTLTPKVEGVLVVAEGAGKGNMAGEITQIVQALFGVEAHRVKVMEK